MKIGENWADRWDLWLDSLPGMSPRRKLALASGMGGAEAVYHAEREEVIEMLESFEQQEDRSVRWTAGESLRSALKQRTQGMEQAERILERMASKGILAVTPLSKAYPSALQTIFDPPWTLYFKGEIGAVCSAPCVAVVGARKATAYGRWAARQIGKVLAENGVTTVSGMASGVDSSAHWGALDQGGKTAAVFGCGVDICYPKRNQSLMEEMIENGVVLSEYPPGSEPAPYRFPQRNRIISGLSACVVVAEAGAQSGSLITAGLAMDQGRDVFAVPASIGYESGIGSNHLIRDGAIPICTLDELPELLGFPRKKEEELLEVLLGAEERLIYEAVRSEGEISVDQLCRNLKKPIAQVNGMLTILEMKGMIRIALGKIYIAKLKH